MSADDPAWTLIAPDGRQWTGGSPLHFAQQEVNERIPVPIELDEADRWSEASLRLHRADGYLILSVQRGEQYVEVIRAADSTLLNMVVFPFAIDLALEKAGLL